MAQAQGNGGVAEASERTCDVCGKTLAKYCCPGCSKRSCSVECVKGEFLTAMHAPFHLKLPRTHRPALNCLLGCCLAELQRTRNRQDAQENATGRTSLVEGN